MIAYVVAALAVWRVSVMLVEERGPWDVIWKLRDAVGIYHYPDGTVQAPLTFLAGVLTCVRCASVWLAIPATLLLWPEDWRVWPLAWLGLSGFSVLIEVLRRR